MARKTPEEIIEKVKEFKSLNPEATRTSIARYVGVDISTLVRLEKQGKIELPKALSPQQARAKRKLDWAKTMGRLR